MQYGKKHYSLTEIVTVSFRGHRKNPNVFYGSPCYLAGPQVCFVICMVEQVGAWIICIYALLCVTIELYHFNYKNPLLLRRVKTDKLFQVCLKLNIVSMLLSIILDNRWIAQEDPLHPAAWMHTRFISLFTLKYSAALCWKKGPACCFLGALTYIFWICMLMKSLKKMQWI